MVLLLRSRLCFQIDPLGTPRLLSLVDASQWRKMAAYFAVTLSMDNVLLAGSNFFIALTEPGSLPRLVTTDLDQLARHPFGLVTQLGGWDPQRLPLMVDQMCALNGGTALFAPLVSSNSGKQEFWRMAEEILSLYSATSLQHEMEEVAAALLPFVRQDPTAPHVQSWFESEARRLKLIEPDAEAPFFFELELSAEAAAPFGGPRAPYAPMLAVMAIQADSVREELEAIRVGWSPPPNGSAAAAQCAWTLGPDPNCKTFVPGVPDRCKVCTNYHFLDTETGTCAKTCPAGTAEFPSGISTGSVCLQGFTSVCSLAGNCRCPKGIGLGKCNVCASSGESLDTCLECEAGWYLVDGRCLKRLTCPTAGWLPGFNGQTSTRCTCDLVPGGDCLRCYVIGGGVDPSNYRCRKCTNGKYRSPDDLCIEGSECPAPTVPTLTGLTGRKCSMPFVCANRKREGPPKQGSSCNCEGSCQKCSWGERGHSCIKCGLSTFLTAAETGLGTECAARCPAGQAHVGRSVFNRFCSRQPHTCKKGISVDTGLPCSCPAGCRVCTWALDNQPGVARCDKCKKGFTLPTGVHADGRCLKL